METNGHSKSFERMISQKAMQMGSSSACKIWVLGFFSGVCLTYFFGVALSPLRIPALGLVYSSSEGATLQNATSTDPGSSRGTESFAIVHKVGMMKEMQISNAEKVMNLYDTWSALLNSTKDGRIEDAGVPQPPHLENCKLNAKRNIIFDNYGKDGSFPPWTLWKGSLGLELLIQNSSERIQQNDLGHEAKYEGLYPPWVVGSDDENYPLTRQVQRDLWIHQHPQNCSDPKLRFLVADWERLPGFGIGAQLAGMTGLLAIAIKEKRILVANYYNRADHDGCEGSARSSWYCYFLPETSLECRDHALELMKSQDSWTSGIIKVKENYTSKEIWAGRIPRSWGEPWRYLQPTTEIDGSLLTNHRKMDRRWWRAQAIRYLMRFQTEYTCNLLNIARHSAFGVQAARLVTESHPAGSSKAIMNKSQSDIEHFVWSDYKPYVPRPLLSIHVRMGDKACEMTVFGFEKYMELANRIRERFPNLKNIWLSTEMQEVIDKTKMYPAWNFYYTDIARQTVNTTMAVYEASLGRETSTNYPLVNFIMATEADFFIGALGSTWCYLIDGMRNTGGKVMSGYLSVNKDRFW